MNRLAALMIIFYLAVGLTVGVMATRFVEKITEVRTTLPETAEPNPLPNRIRGQVYE